MKTLLEQCKSLKKSSIDLSISGTDVKNKSLLIIADYLKKFEKEIMKHWGFEEKK